MRTRGLLPLLLPGVTVAVLAIAPAAGGVKIPRVPRAPRLATYQATLDVSGWVNVKVERDDTDDCAPGQDVVVEFDANFDLGQPRRVTVTIFNGAVATSVARRAGRAVHEGRVTSYSETNYCPPTRRVELEEPVCGKQRGAFRAWLAATPTAREMEDDPAPLVHGVNVAVMRDGGGMQDPSCMRYLNAGIRASRGISSVLNTLELDKELITVPIGSHDFRFLALGKGKSIRRVVRLNGACNHVLLGSEVALGSARDRYRCTVTGKIFVAFKRTS